MHPENDNLVICRKLDLLLNVTDSIYAFAKQELSKSSTDRGIQMTLAETEFLNLLQLRVDFKCQRMNFYSWKRLWAENSYGIWNAD
jgi:hypothetical protein